MSWLSEFRVDAKAPRRRREGSQGAMPPVLLGLCPTRAVGESTTYGSKPYRYDLLLH